MAVEQKFLVEVDGTVHELTREAAETLYADLGEALGGPTAATQDLADLVEEIRRLITQPQMYDGPTAYGEEMLSMNSEDPFEGAFGEEQQGVPAGPSRTLSAEQMAAALEKRLAAEQAMAKHTARQRTGLNPGSGIGSGKP